MKKGDFEIEIRPIIPADLDALTIIDHSYHTDYVWQMAVDQDEGMIAVKFREIRLPRSMRVDYPWPGARLSEDWQARDGILVSVVDGLPVGYISIARHGSGQLATVKDLVVTRRLRRHGIGTALVQAVSIWLTRENVRQIVLEMQSKNHPAISLANQLGFDFCGYSDQYYPNLDIALFFSKRI